MDTDRDIDTYSIDVTKYKLLNNSIIVCVAKSCTGHQAKTYRLTDSVTKQTQCMSCPAACLFRASLVTAWSESRWFKMCDFFDNTKHRLTPK